MRSAWAPRMPGVEPETPALACGGSAPALEKRTRVVVVAFSACDMSLYLTLRVRPCMMFPASCGADFYGVLHHHAQVKRCSTPYQKISYSKGGRRQDACVFGAASG